MIKPREFLHQLIENAFSWALQDCNYLSPKYMDRLIAETRAGMKPEQAATWNATAQEQAARKGKAMTDIAYRLRKIEDDLQARVAELTEELSMANRIVDQRGQDRDVKDGLIRELVAALETIKTVLDEASDECVGELWVDDFTSLGAFVDAALAEAKEAGFAP